jgi:histidinol-phosphate phosphatase family protein
MTTPAYDLVVPTVVRPSLDALLGALSTATGPLPERLLIVDDRARPSGSDPARAAHGALARRCTVLASGGRGPAAARNVGWRAARAEWVAFLDDDVLPPPDWSARLAADLAACEADVGGTQGRVRVPLPRDRRPTDWERQVHGLEDAWWAIADMAYRRTALARVGGFDEGFRRAYREDADLALRVESAGFRLVRGTREVVHPVRPADAWVSVRRQAGNADDPRMRRRHGADWRARVRAPRGRRGAHVAVTAAAAVAIVAAAARRPRLARLAALAWLAGTAELAWARVAPGPWTGDEVLAMLATSAVIPPVATAWWLYGYVAAARERRVTPVAAVLFDRDGTLIEDVPANADPARVAAMPGAAEAVARVRAAGLRTAVVSNQAALARGTLTPAAFAAVNRRVEALLGPLGPWVVCAHAPEEGCGCRKPAPGLVRRAAAALGVPPAACVVVGDIGADVEAAHAAGARAILVPTPVTRAEEIAAAPAVAPDLPAAVAMILGERP